MATVRTNAAAASNFGSFMLDLNGTPFTGRETISSHPAWCEGCEVVLRRRDTASEEKRVGTT